MWALDRIELNGGFLPGLKLTLPHGLICIIGPRGSGKSTLAEALRFAIKGTVGASKQRLDLLQANIGGSGLVTLVAKTDSAGSYTIKRGYKQAAVLLSADGKMVPNIDLDRGSFLPLDAYNGPEIEAIADEALGERRRSLLDDLRGEQLSTIHLSLGEHRRSLEANGDRIRATRRSIIDLSERIEEYGDARGRLVALGPLPESAASTEFTTVSRQQQCNTRERKRLEDALSALAALQRDAENMRERAADTKPFRLIEDASANSSFLNERQTILQQKLTSTLAEIQSLITSIEESKTIIEQTKVAHGSTSAVFGELSERRDVGSGPVSRVWDLPPYGLPLDQSLQRDRAGRPRRSHPSAA